MKQTIIPAFLFLITCSTIFMSSCNPDEDAPQSYVTMNIGGQTWASNPENSDVSATVMVVDNLYSTSISAKTNKFNGQTSEIILNFKRSEQITTQQYELTEYNGGLYDAVLYKQNGQVYQMAAGDGGGIAPVGSATVTIENIKDNPNPLSTVRYISGTFSAQVVRNGVTLDITNGVFHDYRSE